MAQNPETRYQNKVLEYLKLEVGGYWIKIHASSFQTKGKPDIIGCYKGKFIGIELKRPDGKGRLSKLQEYNLQQINDNGGVGISNARLEDLKELFKDDKILRLQQRD